MILRIGAHDIQVKVNPTLTAKELYGVWVSYPHYRIDIAPDLGGRDRALTILHESIHGISEIWDLNLSEKATRALEQAVAGLLMDNEEFLDMMCVDLCGREK